VRLDQQRVVSRERYCRVRGRRWRRGAWRSRTKSLGEEERICRPLYDVVTVNGTIVVIAGRPRRRRSFEGVKVGEEALVVADALLQQSANLFPKRTVSEDTPVCLKLRSISTAERPIWVSYLDPAVSSVLDVTDGAPPRLRLRFSCECPRASRSSPRPKKWNFEDRPQRGGRVAAARWTLERRGEQMGGLEAFRSHKFHRLHPRR
jgi:hypothetical protein